MKKLFFSIEAKASVTNAKAENRKLERILVKLITVVDVSFRFMLFSGFFLTDIH